MKTRNRSWHKLILASSSLLAILVGILVTLGPTNLEAGVFKICRPGQGNNYQWSGTNDAGSSGEPGGTWYWMRSPDEEKRVIVGLYNRYCIRCHGVDGRGIWDVPDVPDFTNTRWQASRSDGQIAKLTLEGRGSCMPPFRGTLTLEEAWGMARYLRTFVPGTEQPRPDRVILVPEQVKDKNAPK